jgi:hypothetical protein
LVWDSTNYSCAYNAFFSILFQLWHQDPHKWSDYFFNVLQNMHDLASSFQMLEIQETTFEQVRNDVEETLHTEFGNMFPYGKQRY